MNKMKHGIVGVALLSSMVLGGCGAGSDVVSKSEYDRISEGMSYSQVVSVIGADGTEQASNRMEGVPGVMESVTTKVYAWQNSDGSNMNAMFQNDKLIQKAQFGLK